MRKLFAILLVTLLTSCGGSSSSEPAEATEQSAVLVPPKSNIDYKNIIGKPIKIGNIEVAQYDFPKKMNWSDAKKACANLGEGWKLTSKDELNYLYQNKVAIGGFMDGAHWSTKEYEFGGYVVKNVAWVQYFNNGYQEVKNKVTDKIYVRAIRTF